MNRTYSWLPADSLVVYRAGDTQRRVSFSNRTQVSLHSDALHLTQAIGPGGDLIGSRGHARPGRLPVRVQGCGLVQNSQSGIQVNEHMAMKLEAH